MQIEPFELGGRVVRLMPMSLDHVDRRVVGATRFLWLRHYFGRAEPDAVEIGGRLDGVMRNWQPSLVPGEEGQPRDSAMYSIVPSEWPDVRARLVAMAGVR